MRVRRSLSPRKQKASPFSSALLQLCDRTGALGAALVDSEGEAVDFSTSLTPFEMKVAAAELRLVLQFTCEADVPGFQSTRELVVRAKRYSYGCFALTEGYALVLVMLRRSFNVSRRAVAEAIWTISSEAGLDRPDGTERWVGVQVKATKRRKPQSVWLSGRWRPVDILGRFSATPNQPRDIGYRVQLNTGAELTLVRERLGRWYADQLPKQ